MTGTVLERSLINVAVRIQKLRILRKQALVWIILLLPAIALTLVMPPRGGLLRPELLVVISTTIVGSVLARLLVRQPSKSEAARLVEQANPELNDAVITAVQVSEQSARRPSVLAAMAIQEADTLAKRKDWSGVVPSRQIFGWTLLSLLSFVAMVSSVMAASRYGRDLSSPDSPEAIAEAERQAKEQITELVIEPGHTEIERGAALTVVAKFPGVVPTHAVLEFSDAKKNLRQMAMTETVDAGVFAARMEDITADGTYRVLYDNAERSETKSNNVSKDRSEASNSFSVTTFVRPRLEQVNAVVTPPAWSKRPSETIEDVVRVSVTEGSTVHFKLLLNKPVARAELRPKEGPAIALTPSAEQPTAPAQPPAEAGAVGDSAESTVGAIVETSLLALESNSWTVYLEDAQGRTASDEEQIAIRVTANEPPKLKVTFPGRDINVSPLQEFQIEATASDDFELVDYGVQFSVSSAEPQKLSLKTTAPAETSSKPPTTESTETADASADPASVTAEPKRNATLSHTIELESLNAAPDDMVTYSFWATDFDVDGNPRRVYSDIMFAEVRRFEEIFRESQQQGQQQQQQQQQNQQQQQQGSPIDGLLNLQKEILSATWNTIRAESQVRKEGSFAADVGTIALSQAQAIEQLSQATAEAASDPKVTALAQRAAEEMTAAQKKLEEVASGAETARLSQALPLEQSVLQTLLRMRAAESNVRQQQQQGGGGGGGGGNSASQQQLQQLELDNSRNRYQSEQQAQPQQEVTQQQREQLQVLNRLKELARRQQMVNERLKQLESELRAALTEKEKEEIERELKRLREEQREMLRDVDELAERMDQATDPQNAQSSEMKQQLQEARENVQQASRAMDDGKLSEAISEGTRAERQFEDLKEDFRNQTSSQFEEAVKDLRQQARELSEKQDEVAKQLAGESPKGEEKSRPSLKSDRNRDETQKQLSEQKDRLNRVVEQTKQMIEQAEQTEPLLSNTLYETIRQLKDSRPEEALDAAETLAGRGLWQQSQQAEQAARQGIEQLKSGIEKAADSVLGSEAESLRRAQQQLEEATQKLAGEVASATGEEPKQNGDGAGEESKERSTAGGESEPTDSKQNGRSRSGQAGSEDQKSADGKESKSGRGRQGKQDPLEKGQKQSGEGNSGEGQKQSEGGEAGSEGQSEESEKQGKGASQNKQSGGSGQDGKQSDQEQNEQDKDGKKGGQKGAQKGGEQAGKQGGSGSGGGQQGDQEPNDGEPSKEGSEDSPTEGKNLDQQRGEGGQRGGNERQSSLRNGGREDRGGQREGMGRGGFDTGARPLTGDDYSEWSDQLRDIEEMLDDPELRNRVAQVRDRARAMRAEYKRHGEMPQWDLVKSQLLGEMQLLQQRINQEVSRLQSDRAMVPIDREPVPEEFDTLVQRYYELLGQEKEDEAKSK